MKPFGVAFSALLLAVHLSVSAGPRLESWKQALAEAAMNQSTQAPLTFESANAGALRRSLDPSVAEAALRELLEENGSTQDIVVVLDTVIDFVALYFPSRRVKAWPFWREYLALAEVLFIQTEYALLLSIREWRASAEPILLQRAERACSRADANLGMLVRQLKESIESGAFSDGSLGEAQEELARLNRRVSEFPQFAAAVCGAANGS